MGGEGSGGTVPEQGYGREGPPGSRDLPVLLEPDFSWFWFRSASFYFMDTSTTEHRLTQLAARLKASYRLLLLTVSTFS